MGKLSFKIKSLLYIYFLFSQYVLWIKILYLQAHDPQNFRETEEEKSSNKHPSQSHICSYCQTQTASMAQLVTPTNNKDNSMGLI